MSVGRVLSSLPAPDEAAAEARAWSVVRGAYAERAFARRRRFGLLPAAASAVGVVLAGALALSPAGATVGRLVTHALGVRDAAPRLIGLPAPGRLLVSAGSGTWTVGAGGVRRIGVWADASWSPHGRYLAVAGPRGLAAVNPRGIVQWDLARPAVSDPRWYAPSGYRVAYLTRTDLRVVAGDGSGDHLVATHAARVAPAWRPGHPYELAYVAARGRLVVRDGDTARQLWALKPGAPVLALGWSADGTRLFATSATQVSIISGAGHLVSRVRIPDGGHVFDAELSPDGRTLAVVSGGGLRTVNLENVASQHPSLRRVLTGPGLGRVAWSPNGRWLLIAWPTADQWVFLRVGGRARIRAVSRIAGQFSSRGVAGFPQVEGWCCRPDRATS